MAKKFHTGVDASGQKVANVATPTAGTDAATKAYVDSKASTVDFSALITN